MSNENKLEFPFKKQNYIILVSGVLTIIIGFLLMAGGGSEDPNVFSPEVFSPRRITVAPVVVLLGFAIVMFAILKKPKD